MTNHVGQLALLSAVLLCRAIPAAAQVPDFTTEDAWRLKGKNWDNKLESIRVSSSELLEQYRQLKDDYQYLSAAHAELQSELEPLRKSVALAEKEVGLLRGPTSRAVGYQPDALALEGELSGLEAINAEFRQRLQDLTAGNMALQDELSALIAEKGEVELQLEKQRFTTGRAVKAETDERLEALQAEYDQLQSEQSALREETQEWRRQSDLMYKEIQDLRSRNAAGAAKLSSLSRRLGAHPAAPGKVLPKQGGDNTMKALVREKKDLKKEIARLESELSGIKEDIIEASDMVSRKQELMDQIIDLNSENQYLRQQLRSLSP